MGGGGGGGSSYQPQAQMMPAPQANLQTTGYGGMGYYSVPNPFTQATTPSWMSGYFSAPWWGTDVMGNPITQDQLQNPAPAAAAPAEQTPVAAPVSSSPPYSVIRDQLAWEDKINQLKKKEGGYGAYIGLMNSNYSPMAQWERQQFFATNRDSGGS